MSLADVLSRPDVKALRRGTLADLLGSNPWATSMLLSVLATMAMGLLLRTKRPKWWPTDGIKAHVWHTCTTCRELVRPADVMCSRHWGEVPPIARMAVRRELPGSPGWIRAAARAVESRRAALPDPDAYEPLTDGDDHAK